MTLIDGPTRKEEIIVPAPKVPPIKIPLNSNVKSMTTFKTQKGIFVFSDIDIANPSRGETPKLVLIQIVIAKETKKIPIIL